MIRTIVAVILIFLATFLLPFWVQLILYVVAIIFVENRVLLLLPALFADAWYSPSRSFDPMNNKTVLLVAVMIIIYLVIIRRTRIAQSNGL